MESTILEELRFTKQRKQIVEELTEFVFQAQVDGALNPREAEAIMHPLHENISQCLTLLNSRRQGMTHEMGPTITMKAQASKPEAVSEGDDVDNPADVEKDCRADVVGCPYDSIQPEPQTKKITEGVPVNGLAKRAPQNEEKVSFLSEAPQAEAADAAEITNGDMGPANSLVGTKAKAKKFNKVRSKAPDFVGESVQPEARTPDPTASQVAVSQNGDTSSKEPGVRKTRERKFNRSRSKPNDAAEEDTRPKEQFEEGTKRENGDS